MEGKNGFELRHREFLLFPTFEHQHAASLQPEFQTLAGAAPGDGIHIDYLAKVPSVFPAPDSIGAPHIWNERFLEMRRGYRPDLPLYLIFVRVYRLALGRVIPGRPRLLGAAEW